MKQHFNFKAVQVAVIALSASVWLTWADAQTAAPAGKTDSSSMSSGSNSAMGGMDMNAMMKDHSQKMSSMKMTGNPDLDFAMKMKMHHQGAIDMAQVELRDGKDPQMLKMATAIISAQKKEMAQFDNFLAKNGHDMKAMSK